MNDMAYPSTTERVKSWLEACPGDPRVARDENVRMVVFSGDFTGRRFDGAEALRMGLVNRIAEPEALEGLLAEYATAICTGAPLTIKAGKRIIRELLELGDDFDRGLCRNLILECFESEDYIEGRRAFMEKRKPVFKGK